jgi:ABC-type bacteriocin/lantibiotic exporter with double-glycine peptidase domain
MRAQLRSRTLLCTLLALSLTACYRGGGRPLDRASLEVDPGWIALPGVPEVQQKGERDCGAAAAAMVLGYWGIPVGQEEIRSASLLPESTALSAGFLRDYLRGRGLRTYLIKGTLGDLETELRAKRPVLVGVIKPYLTTSYAHYLVVIGLNPASHRIAVIDPADGWREYPLEAFSAEWTAAGLVTLVASQPAL